MTTTTQITVVVADGVRGSTAADVARERARSIRALMATLQAQATWLESCAKRSGAWGFVGDLARIEDALRALQGE